MEVRRRRMHIFFGSAGIRMQKKVGAVEISYEVLANLLFYKAYKNCRARG